MNWDTILHILSYILFETSYKSVYSFVTALLFLFGIWGIFKKCGGKGWWALMPVYRDIKLGQCANREEEGKFLAITDILTTIMAIITVFLDPASPLYLMLAFGSILVGIFNIVYNVKIGMGLLELFGKKKVWILLWIIIPSLPAILWGWLKQNKPQWTLQEVTSEAATFFSNSKAVVLDQGLTVNLEERTATEMFKKKYLLRDIHMYIKPGHMVLLLGGSGAGKTTFVNAVNGYEPAKAEVVMNGENMYKEYKHMQYDIGFVPQQDLMRGSDTVFRTLMDAAALRLPTSFTKAERQARVDHVMEIFGLTPVKGNLVSKLSGGQRKRLSIAMEFISNPTLFILDEPDSGLDGVMARELFVQLREIADQGKIIMVITHTPDRVIDLFDDVIVLAKDAKRTGRLAWFGSIEEARAFFGKEKMEEIVKAVNRQEEGGEGRADEFIMKYAEVQHV